MDNKELAEYIATHEQVIVRVPTFSLEDAPKIVFHSPDGMTARQRRRQKQRSKRKVRYGLN